MQNLTPGIRPADLVQSRARIERVREGLRLVRANYPELEPLDLFMVSVLLESVHLERERLARKTGPRQAQLTECFFSAWDLVAAADMQLAIAAGMISRLEYAPATLQQSTKERVACWVEEYVNLPRPYERDACAALTPRRKALLAINRELSDARIVPTHKLYERIGRGMKLAAWKRGERPTSGDPEYEPQGLWLDAQLALAKPGDVLKRLYVEGDGRIGFGAHGVRDTQSLRRTAPEKKVLSLDDVIEGKEPTTRIDLIKDDTAPEPRRVAIANDQRETVWESVRLFLRRELPRSRPGSARRIVLKNLVPLLTGTIRLRDLSEQGSRSEAALSEALAGIKRELAASRGLRELAE